MTRQQFVTHAIGLPVTVGGYQQTAEPKLLKTGSCGWKLQGVTSAVIDGEHVKVLYTVNMTVVGSKHWGNETEPLDLVNA
jgi:hypothetical protein